VDWDTTAAYYQRRLPLVLEVQRWALSLGELPQARADRAVLDTLGRLGEPLRKQLERLSRGEFRIAVVGLEKAGKSTFINAWLDCDLLPNDSPRCTFTTTHVYSVAFDTQQRLEVQAHSPEQFAALIADLERRSQHGGDEGRRAANDLSTIRDHRATLDSVIAQRTVVVQFTRLEELSEPLRRYVADAHYAHAVREARLYTSKLARLGGIVFYDVPGLNSGLSVHIEMSERMLADCDAVILVQTSSRPNIEMSEQRLIELVKEGDETIGIAGKLFVFFGRIDQEGSPESLRRNLELAARDYHTRGELNRKRIIPGSAAAWLLLKNLAGDNLDRNTGGGDRARANLRHVTGASSEEALLEATGMPAIKGQVDHYLRHERVGVLRKRCEEPMQAILEAAQTLFDQVRRRFPEDPEEAKRAEERKKLLRFTEWWSKEWIAILARLNEHFSTKVLRQDRGDDARGRAVEQLRTRYRGLIAEKLAALPSRQPAFREMLEKAYAVPVPDPTRYNIEWRAHLYEDISLLIEGVSRELALELKAEAQALVETMADLLWQSREVHDRLIGPDQDLQGQLQGKLQTLFLRFARPVAMALIRAPAASVSRREMVRGLGPDIGLLDSYYQGDEPAYQKLQLFARYGRQLLINARLRKDLLDVDPPPGAAESTTDPGTLPRAAELNAEVVEEVEADLDALKIYLLEAVFTAAGFEAFCEQELARLCDHFKALKGVWDGAALNEYNAGNPRLAACLPDELRGEAFDTEVSNRLSQLRAALEAARRPESLTIDPPAVTETTAVAVR
jgi:hypothetical protein